MTPNGYWKMFYRHLSDRIFYNNLDNIDNNNPCTTLLLFKSAEKSKSILTNNEYEFLTKR